jgi:hypothetical protein
MIVGFPFAIAVLRFLGDFSSTSHMIPPKNTTGEQGYILYASGATLW